jgi:hypothetical protein
MKENYGSKGKDRYQIAESERTDCIHGAAWGESVPCKADLPVASCEAGSVF